MKLAVVVDVAKYTGLEICPTLDGSVIVEPPAVDGDRKYISPLVNPLNPVTLPLVTKSNVLVVAD